MLLEINYRERLHMVTNEVKRRLDYQIALQDLHRRMEKEHMVNWVEKSVVSSITPQQVCMTHSRCWGSILFLLPPLFKDCCEKALLLWHSSVFSVFQEKESITKCITDLKALAKTTRAATAWRVEPHLRLNVQGDTFTLPYKINSFPWKVVCVYSIYTSADIK